MTNSNSVSKKKKNKKPMGQCGGPSAIFVVFVSFLVIPLLPAKKPE